MPINGTWGSANLECQTVAIKWTIICRWRHIYLCTKFSNVYIWNRISPILHLSKMSKLSCQSFVAHMKPYWNVFTFLFSKLFSPPTYAAHKWHFGFCISSRSNYCNKCMDITPGNHIRKFHNNAWNIYAQNFHLQSYFQGHLNYQMDDSFILRDCMIYVFVNRFDKFLRPHLDSHPFSPLINLL